MDSVSLPWQFCGFYCQEYLTILLGPGEYHYINLISQFLILPFIFQFLKFGSLRDIQLDDAKDFTVTDDAMTKMGMTANEKFAIYMVIAGVLHLGNIAFEENTEDRKGNLST
jgi:hypothetical protein